MLFNMLIINYHIKIPVFLSQLVAYEFFKKDIKVYVALISNLNYINDFISVQSKFNAVKPNTQNLFKTSFN